MNLNLNMGEFKDNVFKAKFLFDGAQYIFKFSNEFGASVVKHSGSYGSSQDLWELAVLRFDGDSWNIVYDTEITGDVLGYLSNEEVLETLREIRDLK